MNNLTEQWKLEGDCSKCRRQKHCNKACKAYLSSLTNDTKQVIGNSKLGKRMATVMSILGGKN